MKLKISLTTTLIVLSLLSIALGTTDHSAVTAIEPSPHTVEYQPTEGDLLLNGSMEAQPYYWEAPNHFVAIDWYRWWTHGTVLPEYDDTRGIRPHYDGDHAQTYFKWGPTYEAGLYQVVDNIIPCTPYRLDVWARNHSLDDVIPHARVGLDPNGTQLTSSPEKGAVIDLPPNTVWSKEQTDLFVWERLSIEAEATQEQITAILYASPERTGTNLQYYYDTFWDAATLIPVSYPDDRLPEPQDLQPTGFIARVITETTTNAMNIEWETPRPASSQVWYNITPEPDPFGGSHVYSNSIHIPLLQKQYTPGRTYEYATPANITPIIQHEATISDLKDGDEVTFVLLSRWSDGTACKTEIYGPVTIEFTASTSP